MAPLYGWGSAVSRLQSLYEEATHFLPLSPQEFLVLIWSTLGPIITTALKCFCLSS